MNALELSEEGFWQELHGKLWHTTHPEHLLGILECGAILNEPEGIPDTERWNSAEGKKHQPYARFIGGVSLFDFTDFNPQRYNAEYALSSWQEFVPYRKLWGGAVWIEIERNHVTRSLLPGPQLLDKWKIGGNLGHNLMPLIEAAHIGPIPIDAIRKALLVFGAKNEFVELHPEHLVRSKYEKFLADWRSSKLA